MSPKDLCTLSDKELLERLATLTRDTQALTAELLSHLSEVDRRQLYLREGCSSLFSYAVEVLHCSEDEAAKRIHAARAARAYPLILELMAAGELHLTAVNLLAPHLTDENHVEVLRAARHQSKRQIEELVARLFPQPDARARLARLAQPHRASLLSSTAVATDATPVSEAVDTHLSASPPLPESAVAPAPPSAPAVSAACQGPRARLAPLSAERYRLQVTLSGAAHAKLRRVQALMRHQNPSGDLGAVIEQAIALLCDKLETRRMGKRRSTESAAASVKRAAPTPEHVAEPGRASRSRYVPLAVRRAVWERDGHQCTYVSPEGRRCTEEGFLELHHLTAFAKGGAHSVEGLTLRCRAHNAYQAVLDFGAEHMLRSMEEHWQSRAASEARVSGP